MQYLILRNGKGQNSFLPVILRSLHHDLSSAGCICILCHMAADWIFCSAAQIPLNRNFKWKLSRFAADQRITWKHVMSHGEGTGLGNTDKPPVPCRRPRYSTVIHSSRLCIQYCNNCCLKSKQTYSELLEEATKSVRCDIATSIMRWNPLQFTV